MARHDGSRSARGGRACGAAFRPRGNTGRVSTKLMWILDQLEASGGAIAIPSADGWELVLRENVGYLIDDDARDSALARLRGVTGLDPVRILAASDEVLEAVVVGMRPRERIERLRRCAELRMAGAPWKAYPGIGRPGVERIELLAGRRAVLALESNGARTLVRLGYGAVGRSYDATYRSVQAAAAVELESSVGALGRAHLLLHRHGQVVCRRAAPECGACPVAGRCPAAASGLPIGDPFATSYKPGRRER